MDAIKKLSSKLVRNEQWGNRAHIKKTSKNCRLQLFMLPIGIGKNRSNKYALF
jgi:hypothetical protein